MTTFGSRAACQAARVTYRQADYWARTKLVTPTTPAAGSGTHRQYTLKDVVLLAVVKRLTDLGLGLDAIRPVVEWVPDDDEDITDMALICDGTEAWRDEEGYIGDVATYRIDIQDVAWDVRRRLQLSQPIKAGEEP